MNMSTVEETTTTSSKTQTRLLTYAHALREAFAQAMTKDERVILLGLDVDDHRGIQGSTLGLQAQFGNKRVFNTPLSEDAMTGVAIGAAMAGLRPIHTHIRMDFLLLCMNQLINMAAKAHYMYGGQVTVPLVVRAMIGRSWGQGAQHSQALHSLFMHIPGLKVVAPSTPHDAKGSMLAAIEDNNPVLVVEHRLLYNVSGYVSEQPYTTPLGKARILSTGSHITIVAVSHMVTCALRAKDYLLQTGIEAEVIDLLSLRPLDTDTLYQSVKKTGHLLIVDNGWLTCGTASEVMAQMIEGVNAGRLKTVPAMKRLGFADTTCPTTRNLEDAFYPNGLSIAKAAYDLLKNDACYSWLPNKEKQGEIDNFKGPF